MDSFLTSKRNDSNSEMDFFDEPMDTSETICNSYIEEGEIKSSDEDQDVNENDTRPVTSSIFRRNSASRVVAPKGGLIGFDAGPDVFDEEEENSKKLVRAKRFSIPIKFDRVEDSYQEKLSNLYRDLGIDKENERHYRFNVIYLRGTQNMKTEDVLEYFELYPPSHVEWVNDTSCNVIWSDDVSAAKALLNLSKRIKNLDKVYSSADHFQMNPTKEISFRENESDEESVDARKINAVIPPGFWRIGKPAKKSPYLLLRYATRSDKIQSKVEKSSEYGLISKSRRKEMKRSRFKFIDSAARIYDEVNQQNSIQSGNKNNPWEDLAYEWGKTDKIEKVDYPETKINRFRSPVLKSDVPDLRISLSIKKERNKRLQDMKSSQNSHDKWNARAKVPRMKMYADDEEERLEKTYEKALQKYSISVKPVKDLRSKINKNKNRERFKLRVEKKQRVDIQCSEYSSSENECDGDSEARASEHYQDLRYSLSSNKKQNHRILDSAKYNSENDNSDNSEFFYEMNSGQRSPLQIEIDNDEYYLNRSNKR